MDSILIASEVGSQTLAVVLMATCVLMVGLFAMVVVMATKYYKRCPSNRILVIMGRTGEGKDFECVHGGARFVIPLLQDCRWLSLDVIRIEITGPAATDALAESLLLPNVFNVAIGTEPDLMQHAAKHLLDLTGDEIRQLAEDAIAGRLDNTLAEQRSRPSDNATAAIDSLNETVESDLNQIGLTLINSRRV